MFMNIDQNEVIMKLPLLLSTALIATSPALAQTDYTELFAEGPRSALRELAFKPGEKSPSDLFALGAAQVLVAVETAYQTRYDYGLSGNGFPVGTDLPFFRSAIPANPDPKPFEPEVIDRIFEVALRDLLIARFWLDQINDEDEVAVQVDLTALWMDINQNGGRDAGEEFYTNLFLALAGFDPNTAEPPLEISVQFDTADAAWLSAYTHMLAGTSELILSVNPSEAVGKVLAQSHAFDRVRGDNPTMWTWYPPDQLPSLDVAMAMLTAIEGPVDPNRSRAAHQHFLDGLADNRTFWARLNAETDNQLEFIPNANQTSAHRWSSLKTSTPPGRQSSQTPKRSLPASCCCRIGVWATARASTSTDCSKTRQTSM